MPKDLNISVLMDFYSPLLTQKQREMLEMYYNDDLSLGEIAQEYGITRQAVRDAIIKGERYLNELEQKLGLSERFVVAQGRIDKTVELANTLIDNINNGAKASELKAGLLEISDSLNRVII